MEAEIKAHKKLSSSNCAYSLLTSSSGQRIHSAARLAIPKGEHP